MKVLFKKAGIPIMAIIMVVAMMPGFVFASESRNMSSRSESGFADIPQYTESQFSCIYNTETATLSGIEVKDISNNNITTPIRFRFWNAALQRYEADVTSSNGVVPDVQLIKGDHYIVYALDNNYNFAFNGGNAHLLMNDNSNVPVNDRYYNDPYHGPTATNPVNTTQFLMKSAYRDSSEQRREEINLNIIVPNADDMFSWSNVDSNIVFTSPYDTVTVRPDQVTVLDHKYSFSVELLEDTQYVVSVDGTDLKTL